MDVLILSLLLLAAIALLFSSLALVRSYRMEVREIDRSYAKLYDRFSDLLYDYELAESEIKQYRAMLGGE